MIYNRCQKIVHLGGQLWENYANGSGLWLARKVVVIGIALKRGKTETNIALIVLSRPT